MTVVAGQPVAVLLAVGAAVSFAGANVLQQRVASRLPGAAAVDPAVLGRLARRPLWLLGLGAILAGFGLQAVALGAGRLVVIEPVLASSLLFALVLAAWAERRRMRAGEWAAAIATFAGLAAFLVAAHPSGGRAAAGAWPLGGAAAAAVALAVGCAALAARTRSSRRAVVLGVGGGVSAGVTDALTKSVAALAEGRGLAIFADPRLYLLAAVGMLTYTLQQNGYRAAALAAFLPTFAVLDPVVGSLLGLLIYHERLGGGPLRISLEAAAALAASWGIVRLARLSAVLAGEPAPVQAVPGLAGALAQPEPGQDATASPFPPAAELES